RRYRVPESAWRTIRRSRHWAEHAGFDLQLSGHTHAGQFFLRTFVIHLVHGPHPAGLSRRGRLWVYGSARASPHEAGAYAAPPRAGERWGPGPAWWSAGGAFLGEGGGSGEPLLFVSADRYTRMGGSAMLSGGRGVDASTCCPTTAVT